MSLIERALSRGPSALAVAAIHAARAGAHRALGRRLIKRRVNGYWMWLDVNDPGISRALNLYGTREGDMKFMLERFAKMGMTIFDIGANIGYYPLLELQIMAGMGRLVCIEPAPRNVELLRENLKLNGWNDVAIIEGAVSRYHENREFSVAEHFNLGSFHPVSYIGWKPQKLSIGCHSIAELARRHGAPDLIRMDIEGHEVEVLWGVVDHLNNHMKAPSRAPIIIFETHHDRYGPAHDIAEPLKELFSLGYQIPMLSSARSGTTPRIRKMGYAPWCEIETDATRRCIFGPIKPAHGIDLICGAGGARTIVLQKFDA